MLLFFFICQTRYNNNKIQQQQQISTTTKTTRCFLSNKHGILNKIVTLVVEIPLSVPFVFFY
jgi:hypothetical protein